jgi:hypothetical protein
VAGVARGQQAADLDEPVLHRHGGAGRGRLHDRVLIEAISDFPARAMPMRPASRVCSGPWPQPALAEAQFGVRSRPRGSVVRRMLA